MSTRTKRFVGSAAAGVLLDRADELRARSGSSALSREQRALECETSVVERAGLRVLFTSGYTSAASEVSMLFVLYQMASGGGPGFLLGVKDGVGVITLAVLAGFRLVQRRVTPS